MDNEMILLSTKGTKLIRIVGLSLATILWILSIIGFTTKEQNLVIFLVPIIYMTFIMLRIIPQKTIYYNDIEVAYFDKNKLQKICFSEITGIERKSYFNLIYEIKTKQKRKLFDRLLFTPRFSDLFKSFGFLFKSEGIKSLEEIIKEK
jgi:hypothetical protein